MTELTEHWNNNAETFNLWIDRHERLQISADILQPFIKPFMEANPTVNLNACQDCIIDMLIWVRREVKKQTKIKDK